MPSPPRPRPDLGIQLITGRRLSRRDFLKLAGATGAATAGLALSASVPGRLLAQSEPEGDAPARPAVDTVAELSAKLGHDPEAIFRFVSESVRYEPYAGLLRGPWSTLAGRAGNAVDQAALLTLLLRHAGVETRYAWGPIEAATADAFLSSSIAGVEDIRAQAVEAFAGLAPGEQPPDPAELPADARAELEAALARKDDVSAWLRDQLDATLGTLGGALEGTDVQVPSEFASVPRSEIEQHVWVQARLDDSAWVDLDPTPAAGVMGSALTEAVATASALPDELYHRVELKVLGERLADDGAEIDELLTVEAPVWELSRAPVTLLNATADALPPLASAFAAVAGVRLYTPVLMIGEEGYAGGPLRFAEPASGGGGLGGGFFAPSEVEDEAIAQWLELRLLAPEREPTLVRRAVFDRVDPADRAAVTFSRDKLAPTELAAIDEGGTQEIAAAMPIWWLTVNGGMPDVVGSVGAGDDFGTIGLVHQVTTRMAETTVGPPLGVRAFSDGPNITATTFTQVDDPANAGVEGIVLDILHRSAAILPVDGVAPTANASAIPGVVAHLTERLLLEGYGADAAASGPSVGAVFDAAKAAGIPIVAYTSPDAVDPTSYAPGASARLRDRLSEGLVAIAPAEAVSLGGVERVGWWLVDPATGRVADEMDDGRGEGSTGYKVIQFNAKAVMGYYRYQQAKRMRCILLLTAVIITVLVSAAGGLAVYLGSPEGLLAAGASLAGTAGLLVKMAEAGCGT